MIEQDAEPDAVRFVAPHALRGDLDRVERPFHAAGFHFKQHP